MRLEQEQRKNLRDREETPREDFERKRALVHQRWMEDFRAKRRAAMVENIQSKIRDINHLEKVQRRAEAIRAERPPPSAPFDHLDRQDQEFRARMRGWYRQGYRDPLIEAIRDQPSVTPAQAQKAYYEARAPGWNWSRLIEEQNQILLERRETMLRRRNEIRNAQQAQGLYPLYPGIWPPYVCQEPVEGEQCNCEQCEDNREYYVDGDEFENN
jgi:hypothetical protein